MNVYTVAKASQGLADYVIKNFAPEKRKIAVSFDSRIKSDVFAKVASGVFAANGIIGSAELRVKYDKPPIDTAKDILAYVKLINDAAGASAVKQLTVYAANPLNAIYVILRDIQAIAQKAEQEEAKAQKDIVNAGGFAGTDALSEAALASMDALCTQLENMEVYENVAN